MTDVLSPQQRRYCMAQIRSRDTKPELVVRRLAHALGYRFRLHRGDLPGKPDLVFPRLKKVIFVHGCFWHQHHGCRIASIPQTRQDYWLPKFERTKIRDREAKELLQKIGWQVMTVWECETRRPEELAVPIDDFLKGTL